MSVDDPSEDRECPLCMEKLEIDDLHFYPCICKYQVCRFCWHRIRTDENGLCPACRTPYPEDPVNFQPLTPLEMQQLRTEKKQKEKKRNVSENRKHLAAYRVLQQNLVYVLGLSPRIADPEILKSNLYFGKFGKVQKVAVGTLPSSTGNTPIYTAYVTFNRVEDALKTILETNSIVFDGRVIKTSLGTTKYCSNFLRGMTCHKQECMYLHEVAPTELSFTKEDMHQGKHTEFERRMIEKLSRKTPEGKNKVIGYSLDIGSSLPSVQPEERISPLVPELEEEESDDGAKSSSGVSRQNSNNSDSNTFDADPVYDYRSSTAIGKQSTEKIAVPFSSQSSSNQTLVPPVSAVNEDELGFDPLAESLKGLAELLQQEEQKQMNQTTDLFSSEQLVGKDFGRLSMNNRQPFNLYSHDYSGLQRDSTSGSMLPPCNNGVFGNFQNGYRSQQQQQPDFDHVRESNYYNQLPPDYFSYRPEQNFSFLRQDPSRNVSSYGGLNSNSNSNPIATPNQNIHETRDAFKALLPNVNVSFVSSAAEMRSLLSSSPNNFGQSSNSYAQENYRGFPDLGYQQNIQQPTSYNSEIGRQTSGTASSSKWMVSPPPGFDSSGRNQGQG